MALGFRRTVRSETVGHLADVVSLTTLPFRLRPTAAASPDHME